MSLFKKSKGNAIVESAIIFPIIALLIATFLSIEVKVDKNVEDYCDDIEDDINEVSDPVISAEVILRNKHNSNED